MDLSDLSTFSVQLASVMSRNDTTTYVPYASSSSSSSSSMMLSMAELLPSDFVYEGVDKTSDGTDSNAGSKRKTESRDLENGGREGAESRRREDGPSATKRAKKMYVGCAYTNQFLIENGVKPADLEQSRARAITAMNPTKTAGMVVEEEEEEKEEEEKERGRGEGKDGKKVGAHRAASASGAQMLVPTEDLGLFIDAHHRSFLGHTLGVVDNTVQLLTDTMEALDISRNAAARWSKGVDEYGVNGCDFEPVIDIKEVK